MLFARLLSAATSTLLPMSPAAATTVPASFALVALPKVPVPSATAAAAILPITLRLGSSTRSTLPLSTATWRRLLVGRLTRRFPRVVRLLLGRC